MRTASSRLARVVTLTLAPAALCLALAGCGSPSGSKVASAAGASPTPTCPATTPTTTFKVVTGKITAASAGTITVAPTSGANVTVQVTATTRLTKLAPSTISAVQVGEVAQVTPDSSGVIATRITVSGGTGGFRGGTQANAGTPGVTRTPGVRFNPACFRRGTPGGGGAFGAAGGQGGRVTSVSGSQIDVTDAQGQSLTYTVTSSTVVIAPTAGSAADLVVGATVTATGTASGAAIVARAITIRPAGQ